VGWFIRSCHWFRAMRSFIIEPSCPLADENMNRERMQRFNLSK
jgi:hypothetical protein